jgi:hypothetical protein
MTQTALIAAIFTLLAGSLSAADQQLMGLVMPDAKVMAGINLDQAKTSPFAQFVLAHLSGSPAPDLQKMIDTTGFDPRRDVSEVLVATAADPAHPSGVLLARGNFNVGQISAAAQTAGGTASTYNGATLITAQTNPNEPNAHVMGVAFLGTTVAITGDLDSVKAAVDRQSAASSVDPALAAKVNQLSSTNDAWSVSIAPLSSLAGGVKDTPLQGALQGDLLKKIQQTSGGIKFGAPNQISGEAVTSDPKDATALGDVVKFLATMIQTNGKNNQIATLAQNLNVTTDGATLKVALSIPEDQLESFLNAAKSNALAPQKAERNRSERKHATI